MSKISKVARLGIAIQGLAMIDMLMCVFLSKPVSDIWMILFVCGIILTIVPEIIGAIMRKEKSSKKSILIVVVSFVIVLLLMQFFEL